MKKAIAIIATVIAFLGACILPSSCNKAPFEDELTGTVWEGDTTATVIGEMLTVTTSTLQRYTFGQNHQVAFYGKVTVDVGLVAPETEETNLTGTYSYTGNIVTITMNSGEGPQTESAFIDGIVMTMPASIPALFYLQIQPQ